MIGDIVSAAGSLVGGYMAGEASKEAARLNIQHQKEFAQKGIQWKTADAKAAGIHPLYALGAQTHSFAPVSFGSGMGPALASAGQDVGRAINSQQTGPERATAYSEAASKLQLDNMALQNQLLASRVKVLNQAGGPPPAPENSPLGPAPEAKKQDDIPLLQMGGSRINTDKHSTNANKFEDRWGEYGGGLAGLGVMANDLTKTFGEPSTWPLAIARRAWNYLSADAQREWGNFQNFTKGLQLRRGPRPLGRR